MTQNFRVGQPSRGRSQFIISEATITCHVQMIQDWIATERLLMMINQPSIPLRATEDWTAVKRQVTIHCQWSNHHMPHSHDTILDSHWETSHDDQPTKHTITHNRRLDILHEAGHNSLSVTQPSHATSRWYKIGQPLRDFSWRSTHQAHHYTQQKTGHPPRGRSQSTVVKPYTKHDAPALSVKQPLRNNLHLTIHQTCHSHETGLDNHQLADSSQFIDNEVYTKHSWQSSDISEDNHWENSHWTVHQTCHSHKIGLDTNPLTQLTILQQWSVH